MKEWESEFGVKELDWPSTSRVPPARPARPYLLTSRLKPTLSLSRGSCYRCISKLNIPTCNHMWASTPDLSWTRGTHELLAAGVLSHATQCAFILSFCSDFHVSTDGDRCCLLWCQHRSHYSPTHACNALLLYNKKVILIVTYLHYTASNMEFRHDWI